MHLTGSKGKSTANVNENRHQSANYWGHCPNKIKLTQLNTPLPKRQTRDQKGNKSVSL